MPPSPASRTQTVWIALSPLLFTFLWSTGFVGAKFGLPYAEPLTYLLLRFVLAAALLVPIALMLKISWPKRHEIKHVALVGLLVQGVYLGGVFIAIHNGVQAGVAALIVSAQPILTAALAGPMQSRPPRSTLAIEPPPAPIERVSTAGRPVIAP